MPTVSYDGQSLIVNGRRFWLCGASVPYAHLPRDRWLTAINSVAEAGFNLVEVGVPWLLHERRPDRFDFSDNLDIAAFVRACGDRGLRVLLRAGPYIGGSIDGGGLPAWLSELPNVAMREANDIYLERVSQWYHRLFDEVAPFQATELFSRSTRASGTASEREGGPLLLVQIEHDWHCSNDLQGAKYLGELARYARECGIKVPLLSANALWQEVDGTIETWSGPADGPSDLLVNLRQLRSLQPHAPRIVTSLEPGPIEIWHHANSGTIATSNPGGTTTGSSTAAVGAGQFDDLSADELMLRLGQILAAGGQAIISPFHSGMNRGFVGGRLPGGPDIYPTTRTVADAPLDEAGRRGSKYGALKRIAQMATSFGHVFAELDPDYHPIVADVESTLKDQSRASLSVVPLRGPQGKIVFVIAGEHGPRNATLLLENGLRMDVALGDQPLGWYMLDVDLLGQGRLDWSNLCPWALVNRTILVLQGPAGSPAMVSVNDGPMHGIVPDGKSEPLVVDLKGIVVVVCNQKQIDATYHDGTSVFVGCCGFDEHGTPIAAPGFSKVRRIDRDGSVTVVDAVPQPREVALPKLDEWSYCTSDPFTHGSSPRYATLDGPMSLVACGAREGYGWYRVKARSSGAAKKRLVHMTEGGDRLHLYIDGSLHAIIGEGPGAVPAPFELRLGGQEVTLSILADNLGRFAGGNDLGERKGLPAPLLEVAPLKGIRAKKIEGPPADPFKLRGFITGRAVGQPGSTHQIEWAFMHRRKSHLLITVRGMKTPGTLLLNDAPLAYYAGASGGMSMVVEVGNDLEGAAALRVGKNAIRFSPDVGHDANGPEDPAKFITIHEVLRDLAGNGSFAFAKFDPPATKAFQSDARRTKGIPCWWRTEFSMPAPTPLWLCVGAMSKGVVYLNGRPAGRYFSKTVTGKSVGPQTTLHLPAAWLRTLDGDPRPNELLIFDEHGAAPTGVSLSHDPNGAEKKAAARKRK